MFLTLIISGGASKKKLGGAGRQGPPAGRGRRVRASRLRGAGRRGPAGCGIAAARRSRSMPAGEGRPAGAGRELRRAVVGAGRRSPGAAARGDGDWAPGGICSGLGTGRASGAQPLPCDLAQPVVNGPIGRIQAQASKPNNGSFFFLAAKTEQASSSTAAAGPSPGIGGRATDSPEEEGVGVGVPGG